MFERNKHLEEAQMAHPTFNSVGENMWVGPAKEFNASVVIRSWYEERENYTFQNDSCSADCSYYVQVSNFYVFMNVVYFLVALLSSFMFYPINKLNW